MASVIERLRMLNEKHRTRIEKATSAARKMAETAKAARDAAAHTKGEAE